MNIAEIQSTLNNNQKIKRIRKIECEVWWIPGEQQNIHKDEGLCIFFQTLQYRPQQQQNP